MVEFGASRRIIAGSSGCVRFCQYDERGRLIWTSSVDAWDRRDYDSARASLPSAVHVVVRSVEPEAPRVDTTGVADYMEGLCRLRGRAAPGAAARERLEVGRAMSHRPMSSGPPMAAATAR